MRARKTDQVTSDPSRHGMAALSLVATLVAAGEGYAAGWAAYRTLNETDQTLDRNHARP